MTVERLGGTGADHPPNPYVGPRSFEFGESLYGRDQEADDLTSMLTARRVVLLYSPSGAGKSSLLEAALRPRLEALDFVIPPTIRVGYEPPPEFAGRPIGNRYRLSAILSLEQRADAGHRLTQEELAQIGWEEYLELLDDDEQQHAEAEEGPRDLCLFFDQLEELFTLDPTDGPAKDEFLTEVGRSLRDRGRWALFSMREDFIAQLDPYLHRIPTRFNARYRLDLLSVEAARMAMQKPSLAAGVDFSQEAADYLLDDLRRVRIQRAGRTEHGLGPTIEPVQLQVVCRRLWELTGVMGNTVPFPSSIEMHHVRALGNVDESLASFYADAVSSAAATSGVSEREIRDWIESELFNEQGFRTQALTGPGAHGRSVVIQLENAHVLRAESRRGAAWYELAHDRLVEPVRQDNERWRAAHLSQAQIAARTWEQQGRPDTLLMSDGTLAAAEVWAARAPEAISAVDRDYLAASRSRAETATRVRKARRRLVVGAIAALVVLAVVLGIAAVNESRNNQRLAEERAAAVAARDVAQAAEEEADTQRSRAEAALGEVEAQRDLAEAAQAEAERQAANAQAAEAEAKAEAARAEAAALDAQDKLRRAQTEAEESLVARACLVALDRSWEVLIDEDAPTLLAAIESSRRIPGAGMSEEDCPSEWITELLSPTSGGTQQP